jgi:serine/threonine protein kinase
MFSWLAMRSGTNPLTPEEQFIFFKSYNNLALPIREKTLTVKDARTVVKLVRSTLRSQTVAAILKQGFVFDGLLSHGGAKAVLYKVIEIDTVAVKCAKVYALDAEQADILGVESGTSRLIHEDGEIPSIVKYDTVLEFHHESAPALPMAALIMPLFTMSLAEILDAFAELPLPTNMFRAVALCVLTAGARFHSIGYSHCDIKPENIMTGTTPGSFTLIDLGSVTKYGNDAQEYTRGYYQDANLLKVDSKLDINCCGVTLARCCVPSFELKAGTSKSELLEATKKVTDLDKRCLALIDVVFSAENCTVAMNGMLSMNWA